MLYKIIKTVKVISKPKLFKELLSMSSSGYLYDIGWVNSFNRNTPVDMKNNPLPWVTYSFIDFISPRLTKEMDIFEYGSGNSTLWYARKVSSIVAIEHDRSWLNMINKDIPKNAIINYQKLVKDSDYSKFPNNLDKKFHIIIVDGRDRVNCIKYSINSLREDGVIVLDDSEREEYQCAVNKLLSEGFKKIDFWGISPGLFYKKCTSIFYKINNCIDL